MGTSSEAGAHGLVPFSLARSIEVEGEELARSEIIWAVGPALALGFLFQPFSSQWCPFCSCLSAWVVLLGELRLSGWDGKPKVHFT